MLYSRLIRVASKDPSKFIDLLDRAMQKKHKIRIVYKAATDDFEPIARLVTPIAWQTKNGYVYCVAYNNFGEVRTYRLDRFEEVKTVSLPGLEGPYSNMYDYYSDIIVPEIKKQDNIYDTYDDIPPEEMYNVDEWEGIEEEFDEDVTFYDPFNPTVDETPEL